MAISTPVVGFMKPFITRALDKNIHKLNGALSLISDNEGNVDIENIISEIIQNLMTTRPFTINTSFIGDIEVGGGTIKLNIPFLDKQLVFNKSDLESFKEILISKS
jgi:hypothetical protein